MYLTFKYYPRLPNPAQENITFEDLFREEQILETPKCLSKTIKLRAEEIRPETRLHIYTAATEYNNAFLRILKDKHFDLNNKKQYYTTYRIPKRNGGVRIIQEPCEDFKKLMTSMRIALENNNILPHTAAYAYIEGKTPKMAVERHCHTKHNWYLKLDLHDFFGSCTEEFIINQLRLIPFFSYMAALPEFVKFWTLNNGLPQGTPMSPWLTNQIMVPFDYELSTWCRTHNIVYTRYADDMIFSANSKEALQHVIPEVRNLLTDTPLRLNEEKTHFSSVYGQNYILGMLANKDYKAQIGHKKKEHFRAALYEFTQNYNEWDSGMAMRFLGTINYYKMIEPEYFSNLLDKYNQKFRMDITKKLIQIIKNN